MSIINKAVRRVYPPQHLGFYLQRAVMNPNRRRSIAGLLASRLPKPGSSALAAEQQQIAANLDMDGFALLPPLLSPVQIRTVREFLKGKECFDRWKPAQGRFTPENAPADCHVAPYQDDIILAAPFLMQVANDPSVLAVVTRLFGCKPTISNLSLWWSIAGHSKPEQAENYHRDVDEWYFIKLFVYLTDVTENSGPHKFIKGSHREPKLLPIRRYEDREVHEVFGKENEIVFTGPAGSCFLENTFGFHKGQLPTSENRLVFQVQYSLHPIGIYKYSPSPARTSDASFDAYINRLYWKA